MARLVDDLFLPSVKFFTPFLESGNVSWGTVWTVRETNLPRKDVARYPDVAIGRLYKLPGHVDFILIVSSLQCADQTRACPRDVARSGDIYARRHWSWHRHGLLLAKHRQCIFARRQNQGSEAGRRRWLVLERQSSGKPQLLQSQNFRDSRCVVRDRFVSVRDPLSLLQPECSKDRGCAQDSLHQRRVLSNPPVSARRDIDNRQRRACRYRDKTAHQCVDQPQNKFPPAQLLIGTVEAV